jgi:hypothetical protein
MWSPPTAPKFTPVFGNVDVRPTILIEATKFVESKVDTMVTSIGIVNSRNDFEFVLRDCEVFFQG